MDKLHLQIEDMRRRLSESAQNEQALVKALNEALSSVDERLLNGVRQVTIEHEVRRGAILNELQLLAARLCAFPASRAEPMAAIEEQPRELHVNGHPHAPGDWRMAASNIHDEIDFYLKSQGPNH